MSIKKTSIYIFFFGVVISYFVGFFFDENSAGAGGYNGDISWIQKNIDIFKNNNIFNAVKNPDFFGNRPPLIYIINKLINPYFFELEKYRSTVFILSLFSPVFLFLILRLRFYKTKVEFLTLLSVSILLSPFYRTSGFWALNENYGILCALVSIFLLKLNLENISRNNTGDKFNLVLTLILSSACVYFDQKLIIIPLICFFNLIYYLEDLKSKILIILIYIILSIPFLYLVHLWGGIVPVKTQIANPNTITNLSRVNDLYFINIGYATTLMALYLFPVILFKENLLQSLKNFFINKTNIALILISIIYITLLIALFDFEKYTVDDYWVGLGYVDKITKILFNSIFLREIITYLAFLVSWIVVLMATGREKINIFIVFYFYLISILLWPLMQEYFDPIILILALTLFKMNFKINFYNTVFLIVYFSIFLISSNLYY